MDAVAVLDIYRDVAADIRYSCNKLEELKHIPQEFAADEVRIVMERLALLSDFRREVNSALDRLTVDERQIILWRRIENRSWARVDANCYYSLRQAQNIYKRGMTKLSEIFLNNDIIRAVMAFRLIR